MNTSDILNETIQGCDIKDGEVNASDLSPMAIANVTNNTAANDMTLGATPIEIINDTFTQPRDAYLIITYTGNVTDQATASTFVKINCSISNRTTYPFTWWEDCKPGTVSFADDAVNNVTLSVQFLNATVKTPPGDPDKEHYIRIMAWTTDGNTAKINDNMLTVIALPA